MPPPHPKLPPLAEPSISRTFDPWNSSSTGHQRSESRGPQGWRESRNMKMNYQFRSGSSDRDRISDTIGVESEDYDETIKMRDKKSVADMLRNPGSMNSSSSGSSKPKPKTQQPPLRRQEEKKQEVEEGEDGMTLEERLAFARMEQEDKRLKQTISFNQQALNRDESEPQDIPQQRKIFDGLVIYINGSTFPLISDHKLKQVLAENGANMSLHLGRRKVTHVILGKPANGPRSGAGGGLAGGKIEKEIRRVGGCGVKYVGVEWVLESLKAGKRLPETRFSNLKLAPRGQQSVFGAFSKAE